MVLERGRGNYLCVEGGQQLSGSVEISGSKNAALPILASTLVFDKPVTLQNVPSIGDIAVMLDIIKQAGGEITINGSSVTINSANILHHQVHHSASRSRSSILTAGPILQRCGKVVIPTPGGCQIGSRLINFHIDAFRKMGANVEYLDSGLKIEAPKGLKSIDFTLPLPSVGATQQIISTALLSDGTTTIRNAAIEPEVVQLCEFLKGCGAKIEGEGTREVIIHGGTTLNPRPYTIQSDRIEAGTYAFAIIATRGTGVLRNVNLMELPELSRILSQMGIEHYQVPEGVKIIGDSGMKDVELTTSPHPGFPTDLQAPLTALFARSRNQCIIKETVHNNRFGHVPELVKMGANMELKENTVKVKGVESLKGVEVYGADLRAAKALIIAALSAGGKTSIFGLEHLYRGYERLVEKLQGMGARIAEMEV